MGHGCSLARSSIHSFIHSATQTQSVCPSIDRETREPTTTIPYHHISQCVSSYGTGRVVSYSHPRVGRLRYEISVVISQSVSVLCVSWPRSTDGIYNLHVIRKIITSAVVPTNNRTHDSFYPVATSSPVPPSPPPHQQSAESIFAWL